MKTYILKLDYFLLIYSAIPFPYYPLISLMGFWGFGANFWLLRDMSRQGFTLQRNVGVRGVVGLPLKQLLRNVRIAPRSGRDWIAVLSFVDAKHGAAADALTERRNATAGRDIGALAGFLIVGTVKLHRARHVAVIVQDIGSVTRHWLVPKQLDIILLDQVRLRDGGCVALPN